MIIIINIHCQSENIGHNFSANSIRNYLKNEKLNISVDTILNYLEIAKNAYVIKKVPRFNITGKQLLKVGEKYYLTDHGFRSAIGFSNIKDIERALENIVYIELISRGYEVSVGRAETLEIDFIARKNNLIEYYQVTYLLSSESTRHREFDAYLEVKDNYPKYVLSMDKMDFSQNGIVHKNIIDFLTFDFS